MITEAIILAGGLGTRLQSVVADVPKCMAPVNGIPFINFVISYLKKEGVERFILSLGYKSEIVIEYMNDHFKELNKIYIIEKEQLDTGGAIKKACESVNGQEVIIVNGDTIFNISLYDLLTVHHLHNADCTIALNELTNFDRYGSVEFNNDGILTGFHEKRFCSRGFTNGGIYILNVSKFLQRHLPVKFSFEKDYLQKHIEERVFVSAVFYNYFIDIGVPDDYKAFQEKYSNSPAINRNNSSDDSFGIIIETIGAFFELLD